MKLKVGDTRVAVSRDVRIQQMNTTIKAQKKSTDVNVQDIRRGMLYASESKNNDKIQDYTKVQIVQRIKNANELYKVFFPADSIWYLKQHFEMIVTYLNDEELKEIKNEDEKKIVIETISKYAGFYKKDRFKNITEFSYEPVGKNIENVMKNYVYEHMANCFYEDSALAVTVQILLSICDGKNYKNNIICNLKKFDVNDLTLFIEACKQCEYKPFVDGTSELEKCFGAFIGRIVHLCDEEKREAYWGNDKKKIKENIKYQIGRIKGDKYLSIKVEKTNVQVSLKDKNVYTCKYYEEERLNVILIRMRKALKRGTNRKVVIALLKGLACGTLSQTISDLETNNEKALIHFIDTVNKDYYKFSIVKSVKNMDVRAQVYKEETINHKEEKKVDESSRDVLYSLSISNRSKNVGLIKTMERYSTSQEESDNVLIELKRLVYEYFMPCYCYDKQNILKSDKIWKFPKVEGVYFDEGFKPRENETKPELNNIKDMWDRAKTDNKTINQGILKKRIKYVNVGRYLQCLGKNNKENIDRSEHNDKEDESRKYWLYFIEKHVEKNYTDNKKNLKREDCLASNMISACWKDIIRTLCGKYIDLGKMVYHIAMPGDMSIKSTEEGGSEYGVIQKSYQSGVSSFMYEDISAEDNLQRSIVGAVVSATNNFTRAVFSDNVDDCLYPGGVKLEDELKQSAIMSMLRFYGGESTFKFNEKDNIKLDAWELIDEQIQLLKQIRDESYHYTPGLLREIKLEHTNLLLKHDIQLYRQLVAKKYYTNNVADFYSMDNIKALVEKLYSHTNIGEAQIPSFRNVWSRADLPKDYADIFKAVNEKETLENEDYDNKHLNAMYFLLKEIYYRDFVLDKDGKAYEIFIDSVNKLNREERPESAFMKFVGNNMNKCKTFGSICQTIMSQYNVQNSNSAEKKYENFKALLHKCTKQAFVEYLSWEKCIKKGEKDTEEYVYRWIFSNIIPTVATTVDKEVKSTYLDDIAKGIAIPEYLKEIIQSDSAENKGNNEKKIEKVLVASTSYIMGWYTLAHYIHPKQLNLLIGEFKNYVQYKNDIEKRAELAGQPYDEIEKSNKERKIAKAKDIISILDFVRGAASGISGKYSDYYSGESETANGSNNDMVSANRYAEYLRKYIDFPIGEGESVFESFKKFCMNKDVNFDIYMDEENPKLLHNVEFARMYAGGDMPLMRGNEGDKGYKVTAQEIRNCLTSRESIADIQSKGRCKNRDEQKEVVQYQQLKGRITLNDVTNIYGTVSELLGKLISLSYLRERDHMYLLLGFYYTMLQVRLKGKETKWEHIFDKEPSTTIEEECEINEGYLSDGVKKINTGLVLYQIIGVFDYGTDFVAWNKNKSGQYKLVLKGNLQLSKKIVMFYSNHKSSYGCAIRLFHEENDKRNRYIDNIRNYVDHSKYYKKYEDNSESKSIMELYSEYYTKCFGYSKRLKQSVIENLKNILENENVLCDLKFITNYDEQKTPNVEIALKNKLSSVCNNYKLENSNIIALPVKSEQFLDMLKKVLESK